MSKHPFQFLPLGGAGEIGMNLNLYSYRKRWLMVDCGVMFGRTGPGTQDVLFPDTSFIEAQRNRLEGLVLTHAHQDHIGAVRDIWPKLKCPVYCTRFAAEMLREPLAEAGLLDKVPIHILDERESWKLGPFELSRIPITHSTVEMGGLLIKTDAGAVFHTGDFKLDPDPLVGLHTDESALKRLAKLDLLAVISDSTNADKEGWTPSEGALVPHLEEVLKDRPGRVAVAMFSSNIARVRSWVMAAHAVGRSPVLLGRSLEKTVRAARAAGYLGDMPEIVPARDYGFLPAENVVLLCTGSQGEPRAALSRLASGTHRFAYLEPGDTAVFSARKIPGCETSVDRVQMQLRELGVSVVTDSDAFVHVSGHPCQDELSALYSWIRPRMVIPVHGTPSKMKAHAQLARSEGLNSLTVKNGDVVQLAPGDPTIVRRIRTGRLARTEDPPRRFSR
jgi:ribonuclease J